MNFSSRRHTVDFAFIITLFCIFTICALLTVLIGAGVYRSTAEGLSLHSSNRTALSYLSEKLRQQEKEGGLSLLTDGSPQAICLTETQDQQSYTTYIYVYNGYLMELLVPAHYSFSPENGIRLFPMERMELSVLTDGIFSILLTDPEGTPFQLYQTERNML